MNTFEAGNHKYDKVAALQIAVKANGPTTGDATFVADDPDVIPSYDPSTGVLTVSVPDGRDTDTLVHCSQPADDPGTAETEMILGDIHFTANHSTATDFVFGSVTEVPR